MPNANRAARVLAIAIAACTLCRGTAHAYIDPGTGSYMLQMLLAGLLGALMAIKMFWRQITAWFSSVFSRGSDTRGDD